jgi:peroxiredoxin
MSNFEVSNPSAALSPLATNRLPSDVATETRRASRVVLSAIAVLLLTDVHHAYGAHVYQTPWRYHVVLLSLPATLGILWSHRRLRRHPGDVLPRWILGLTTLLVPVLGIGAFEGFYNHLVKDVLYFHGASSALMNRLFPPPTYEMPNDAFFEITGVSQAILGAATAWYLYRFGARRGQPTRGGGGAKRIAPGTLLSQSQLMAISAGAERSRAVGRLVHLQFRRFAGCPVCNLHLQSFVRRQSEIGAAGIREVVVFHSSPEELSQYTGQLPFAVIADPDKHLYAEFGVESAPRALLDPRAWGAIVRGVSRSVRAIARGREPVPPIRPRGGRFGLPAEFLIGRDGRVVASKYGEHADDQWSVDDLLRIAQNAGSGI